MSLRNEKGFSFVELLMSLVVVGIISISFAYLFSTGVDSFALVSSRKEALSQGRYAINRMTQELLKVRSTDIQSISNTSFSFTDSSGQSTDFHSQVVNGETQLYRGNDLLATSLNGFTLTYYDTNGVVISDYQQLASLRRIRIDLNVRVDGNAGSVALMGEIYPRNFYYSNFQ